MDGCLARTITKIEANPLLVRGKSDFRMMRVAAYCRVSTDDDDQLNSYQAQIAYYTDAIAKRPNSTFAGIMPTKVLPERLPKSVRIFFV